MYVGLHGCGGIEHLLWGDESGRHDEVYGRLGEYGKSVRADGHHARQNSRDKRRNDDGRPRSRVCGVRAHLVFGDSEGTDSDGSVGNKHATSGHRSDVLHHAAHHYGDDGSARCGDGAGLHGDAVFRDDVAFRGVQDLCGNSASPTLGRRSVSDFVRAAAHVAGHAGGKRDRENLNASCSDGGVQG